MTTNHIADRAGVSIGTLYRYFNDKDDIFYALAREEINKITFKGVSLLNDASIKSGNALIGEFVEIAVAAFDNRPFVRKNLHDTFGDGGASSMTVWTKTRVGSIGPISRGFWPERYSVIFRNSVLIVAQLLVR